MGTPAYRIDVRDILEQLGGVVPVDEQVPVTSIVLGGEEFVPTGSAHLVGGLTNTGAGIVLDGTADLEVTATCSRCLREFPLRITGEVEGFYVHHGHSADLPEEQEFAFIDEGTVDVLEPVTSALALAMPFAPVHAEDCPGICPTCGADLNTGVCECEPDLSGSPFAALKDLLPEDSGDS